MEFLLTSLAETEAHAAKIAAQLRRGDAILLEGPLGAGKTAFARALLRAACADPTLEVPSPSYTLVQTYQSPISPLHHFDLWRLGSPVSLIELGWDEAQADIVIVEWPDRLGTLWPADALHVRLNLLPDGARHLQWSGWKTRQVSKRRGESPPPDPGSN